MDRHSLTASHPEHMIPVSKNNRENLGKQEPVTVPVSSRRRCFEEASF